MRIPWYYCLLSGLVIILLVLFLGVKDKDFVTPPAVPESADNKHSDSDLNTQKQVPSEAVIKPETVKQPKKIIVKQPVSGINDIDLNTSPALDHFRAKKLPSRTLQDYAAFLIESHHPRLAHLALERIIDSTADATTEDINRAAEIIPRLSPPLWSPDPSSRTPITIELKISAAMKQQALALRPSIIEHILKASGGIVSVQIHISTAPTRPGLPALNFFSIPTKNSKPAPKIMFPNSSDLEAKIYAALYNSIRNFTLSATQDQLRPPLPLAATKQSAKSALTSHITRLSWKKFATRH